MAAASTTMRDAGLESPPSVWAWAWAHLGRTQGEASGAAVAPVTISRHMVSVIVDQRGAPCVWIATSSNRAVECVVRCTVQISEGLDSKVQASGEYFRSLAGDQRGVSPTLTLRRIRMLHR